MRARPKPLETTDAPPRESTTYVPLLLVTDEAPRCWRCGRKLAERATRPWLIKCERCQARTASPV